MRYLRYAMVLLMIALVGPSAAAVLATGVPKSHSVRAVAAAPADVNVSGIEFALDKRANATPVNASTRFPFGARRVWAFWAWDNARSGENVHYILRFGQTDVTWGDIKADGRDGRMEVDLARADGDFLMLGRFQLIVQPAGGDTRTAEFVIYDPDAGNNDNGGDNDNGDSNNNNNSNDNAADNNNNNSNDNSDTNNNNNSNGDNNNNNEDFNFNDNNNNDNG